MAINNGNSVALRKRAQIANANRTMFIAVALVSVVVGLTVVAIVFLFQQLLFRERVLMEKQNTMTVVRDNINAVSELEDQIRAMGSNPALLSVRASDEDNALQVILDALPSEVNPLALGASVQDRLLSVDGVRVESITVDPIESEDGLEDIVADENADDETASNASQDDDTAAVLEEDDPADVANSITFQFTVVGSSDQLRELLQRIERSIRTIQITSTEIESQGDEQSMRVEARAFYEPSRVIQLTDKVIRP